VISESLLAGFLSSLVMFNNNASLVISESLLADRLFSVSVCNLFH